MIEWLEEVVLDDSASWPDRLAAGRSRVQLGASLRHEDLRTPFHRVEVIRTADGFFRGTRTPAGETKTHARLWDCISLATKPGCEGCLTTLLRLLEEAHYSRKTSDDNSGKKSRPDKKS